MSKAQNVHGYGTQMIYNEKEKKGPHATDNNQKFDTVYLVHLKLWVIVNL